MAPVRREALTAIKVVQQAAGGLCGESKRMPFLRKRIDAVHGWRSSQREPARFVASILTLERSQCASIERVTETGACLRGCRGIKPGDDLWIKTGCLDGLVTVEWCEEELCGITFDVPLGHDDLIHLRCEGRNTLVMCLAPGERLTAQDWLDGRCT